MRGIEGHLVEGEKVVLATRLHTRVLVAPVAVFVVAATLAAFVASTAGPTRYGGNVLPAAIALVVAVSLRLTWRVLGWSRSRLVLTTLRVLETSGVIRVRASSVPLDSISDVHVARSLAGRMMGYGELIIEDPSSSRRIDPVPRPRRIAQAVMAMQIAGPRSNPLPATSAPDDRRAHVSEPTPSDERARRLEDSGSGSRRNLEGRAQAGIVLDDRYRVGRPLATGGMGRVFRGIDERLQREVVIKLLREELLADERFLERFRREALSAAALSHPNIASIFDYGEQDGAPYIVMELVQGIDLARIIEREGPLEPRRAARIAHEVLDALQHAHDREVIHRDIKPGNVIVCGWDHVKVTDFGIAKAAGASRLTSTGIVLGSAHYMSPEQVRGSPATRQSDVYATGIVLYEMLVGDPPFEGESLLAVAERHLDGTIRPPSHAAPTVPAVLDDLVSRATAVDPRDRFRSADAMAIALRGAVESAEEHTRKVPRTTATRRLASRTRYDTPPLRL